MTTRTTERQLNHWRRGDVARTARILGTAWDPQTTREVRDQLAGRAQHYRQRASHHQTQGHRQTAGICHRLAEHYQRQADRLTECVQRPPGAGEPPPPAAPGRTPDP